jgi:hypothetical protein
MTGTKLVSTSGDDSSDDVNSRDMLMTMTLMIGN